MKIFFYLFLLLLFQVSLVASSPCDDLKYQKIRDSTLYYNYAFVPERSLEISTQFLNDKSNEHLNDCEIYSWILYDKAISLKLERSFEESLKIFYALVMSSRTNGFHQIEVESFLSIALIHEFLGNRTECVENLHYALDVIEKHNVKKSYPRYCVRYSSHLRYVGQLNLAKEYAQKAVEFGKEIGDVVNELDGYLLLGGLEKDPNISIGNFEKASKLYLQRKAYIGASSQVLNAARVLLENNDLERANQFLDRSQEYLEKSEEQNIEYYSGLSYLYRLKKELFSQLNNLDSVIYYLEKYSEVLPLLCSKTNLSALKESESKFQMEIQKQKADLLEEKSKTQIMAIKIGGVALLLLSMLVYFLFINRNKVRRQNVYISNQNKELESAKDKSNMLLSEIHHRMKNSLQNIISLILLKGSSTSDENEKLLLDDIQSKILSLSSAHQNLYATGEFEKVNVSEYLDTFLKNIFTQGRSSEHSITYSNDIDKLNIETIIPLGILISELIFKSNIATDNSVSDSVSDIHIRFENGLDGNYIFKLIDRADIFLSALFKEKEHEMDVAIIKSMCRQLNGDYSIYQEEGTVFKLVFMDKTVSKI